MAKTPYDEPITKNTDWGGDSTTGGRPVAGGRVQDFIKGSLQDLDDRIKNISGLGRFLSGWDCTTGLAVTNPSGSTYEYPDGAFYIVAKVGAKNYRPSGSKYVVGTASKVVETRSVKVGDVYKYDGSAWLLINLDTQEIPAFSNETAGTIRGKAQDGFVSAEDGYGKVQGWQDATQETRGLMTADDKTKLDGVEEGANKTEVDDSLNATSENPVQNKVVKTYFDDIDFAFARIEENLDNLKIILDTREEEFEAVEEVLKGKAPLNSPAFTGTPTAPTPPLNDVSNKVLNTQYLKNLENDKQNFGNTNLSWKYDGQFYNLETISSSAAITAAAPLPAYKGDRCANSLRVYFRAGTESLTITITVGSSSNTVTFAGLTVGRGYTLDVTVLSYNASTKVFLKTVSQNI